MLTPLRSSFRSLLRGAALALALVSIGACADDSDGDDGPGDDGGEGDVCGGLSAATCADDLFCDYDNLACGITDGSGTCQPRPTVCVPVIDEVCGCDGERYSSPCDAHRAGTDVSSSDAC